MLWLLYWHGGMDILYSLRCHPWGSVCRNRFHMTPNAHPAFKHHPLSASAAQGNICKTAMPRLDFVVASCLPTVSFHLISPGLQNLVVRSNSQRLGTLRHETWGLVRQKLLNSLLKWKALCGQNFHIKLDLTDFWWFLLGHPTMCPVFGQPLLQEIDDIQTNITKTDTPMASSGMLKKDTPQALVSAGVELMGFAFCSCRLAR